MSGRRAGTSWARAVFEWAGVEKRGLPLSSACVDLEEKEVLALDGPEGSKFFAGCAERGRQAAQRERLAEGRQRLDTVRHILSTRQRAQREEYAVPVVDRAGWTVDELHAVGEQIRNRVEVPCGDCCIQAGGVRGRGVRTHPAAGRALRFRTIVGCATHLIDAPGITASPLGEQRGALGLPQLAR